MNVLLQLGVLYVPLHNLRAQQGRNTVGVSKWLDIVQKAHVTFIVETHADDDSGGIVYETDDPGERRAEHCAPLPSVSNIWQRLTQLLANVDTLLCSFSIHSWGTSLWRRSVRLRGS